MALSKTTIEDKIEINEDGILNIREATIISEDGVEISRSYHRKKLVPCYKAATETGVSDTWTDTDYSGESTKVQGICSSLWTSELKTAYQAKYEA